MLYIIRASLYRHFIVISLCPSVHPSFFLPSVYPTKIVCLEHIFSPLVQSGSYFTHMVPSIKGYAVTFNDYVKCQCHIGSHKTSFFKCIGNKDVYTCIYSSFSPVWLKLYLIKNKAFYLMTCSDLTPLTLCRSLLISL